MPKKYGNKILKFRIYGTSSEELGKEVEIDLPKGMDLKTIVFIMRDSSYFANGKNEYKHPLFEYLDGVLNNDKELYGKYIDISEYTEIEGRMSSVCNMSEYFINEGVERGKREGINIGVERGKREGIDIGVEQNTRVTAERLIVQNILTFEQISSVTDLSIKKLKEISKNLK